MPAPTVCTFKIKMLNNVCIIIKISFNSNFNFKFLKTGFLSQYYL